MQKEGVMKLRWKYRQVTGGNKGKKSREKKLFYDRINKIEKPLAIMTMGGCGVGGEITYTPKKKKNNFSKKEVALKIHKRDLFSCIREYYVQLYTSLISKSSKNRSFSRAIN